MLLAARLAHWRTGGLSSSVPKSGEVKSRRTRLLKRTSLAKATSIDTAGTSVPTLSRAHLPCFLVSLCPRCLPAPAFPPRQVHLGLRLSRVHGCSGTPEGLA